MRLEHFLFLASAAVVGVFLTDVVKQKVWDSAGVSERHLQTGDGISGNEERGVRQLPFQDLSTDYMLF